MAPAFTKSPDFALNKNSGIPCPNLLPDFRCSIHDKLRPTGFGGCVAYDCFGAGQKVTQITFAGRSWRETPEIAAQMFETYEVMRQLHGLLLFLTEALTLLPPQPLEEKLRVKLGEVEALTQLGSDALVHLQVAPHKAEVNDLLLQVSEFVRFKT